MYHTVGRAQAEDRLCLEMPIYPEWMMSMEVTECGRYGIISVSENCNPANHLYVCDLSATELHGESKR